MRTPMRSIALALLGITTLAACGKEAERSDAKPPSATAPGVDRPTTATPAEFVGPWTGTLEKAGPSIEMQGSHVLVTSGTSSIRLTSGKVKLSDYEGKKVVVTGTASLTVEGHKVIVDVETVTLAP